MLVETGFEHDEPWEQSPPPAVWRPDLRAEAEREAGRLQGLRRLAAGTMGASSLSVSADDGVVLVTALRGYRPAGRRGSAIRLMRARIVDGNGRLVEALLVPLAGIQRATLRTTEAVRQLVLQLSEGAGSRFDNLTRTVAEERRLSMDDGYRASVETTRIREQGLLRLAQANGWNGKPFQAGLFDRRALKKHAAALQSHAAALNAAVNRLGQIAAARTISVADCEPELVLVTTD